MSFGMNSVLGNVENKMLLMNSAKTGNPSHAYIFAGKKGSGRHTLVSSFIAAILCKANKNEDISKIPCGKCYSCNKIIKGIHPDIIYVTSEKKSVGIEEIRAVQANAYIAPNESEYKFIVIEDAERLTVQAQNALLKLLEEPPHHLIFILIAKDDIELISTIYSRCKKFTMSVLGNKDISDFLKEKIFLNHIIDEKFQKAINQAARLSGGNIGNAAYIFEKNTGLSVFGDKNLENKKIPKKSDKQDFEELAIEFLRSFSTKVKANGLYSFNALKIKSRDNLIEVLNSLTGILRDILIYRETKNLDSIENCSDIAFIEKAAGFLKSENIIKLMPIIRECHDVMERNCNQKVWSLYIIIKGWECLND